ncbi:MAG: carbohydrate-binding domain-containing protein, partial [Clostridia bacterium]|nr:carbohydrate-binding domain-containing protein [Clostridia bacterium]
MLRKKGLICAGWLLALLMLCSAVGCGTQTSPPEGETPSMPPNGEMVAPPHLPQQGGQPPEGMSSDAVQSEAATQTTIEALPTLDTGYSTFDLDAAETVDGQTVIALKGNTATVTGAGARWEDGVLTIDAAGSYVLSGRLDEGRILVAAGEPDKVRLVLDGVDITCTTEAPMIFTNADKVALVLAKGSDNRVNDARETVTDEASDGVTYKAAITSHVSLTVNGEGALTVTGNCRNGISTKKNLRIVSGTLTVDAQNIGLKGNDSVSVCGGELTVRSVGDCIKTEEIDNTTKGFVDITGGYLTLTTEGDGISASQYLLMNGGEVNVTTTGTVTASGANSDLFGGGRGGFGGSGGFGGWWGDTD